MIERNSLHHKLKSTTHEIHELLHVHPLMRPLHLDCMLDTEHYIRVLKAFAAFYSAAETKYNTLKGRLDGEATPLPLLIKDLEILNVKHDKIDTDIKPDTAIRDIDFSSYIGYLYVKQGSTLGGQFLSKHISAALGLDKETEIFFFNPYGKDTALMWKNFLFFIDKNKDQINAEMACESALSHFKELEHILDTYS